MPPDLLAADTEALARMIDAGDPAARAEARRRYRPLAESLGRAYCRKLGHRRRTCGGWRGPAPCDLAFLPASERVLDLVCGTDARRGQLASWSTSGRTTVVFEHWLRRRTGGWETEALRAWNAARGLRQRIRVSGTPKAQLEEHLAGFAAHHPAAERANATGLGVSFPAQVWLDALFLDACQTGLLDPIDAERVWRYLRAHHACVDGDLDAIAGGPAAFTAVATAVDELVAASHPALHRAYLELPRSMTRSWLPLDEDVAP